MTTRDPDRDFRAIWQRARNHRAQVGVLTPDLIRTWAQERSMDVDCVEERDVGAFCAGRSIVLVTPTGSACFPNEGPEEEEAWRSRRDGAEARAALWERMEWFSPLWVARGKVDRLLAETRQCSQERAVELFDYHTSTIYTLAFKAVCIAQLLPRTRTIREFCPLAREAYLAFYSGYRASSIAALIPAIEGSLTRIAGEEAASLPAGDRVDLVFRQAIRRAARVHFENMWAPIEYLSSEYLLGQDERVFCFETIRRWLHTSFFRRTAEYTGVTWLNRHLFAHATTSSWQQTANFSRLVVALATLGVVEAWHDGSEGVSFLLPDMNEDSILLWQQALFYGQAQMALKVVEEKRYHEHGRLVPELPTDDGVLMRKAILSEDCIKDLVRPLRAAGWSVVVGEPDEQALYVVVRATSGEEHLDAALLYSCATDNRLYKELDESCQAILYRGAPYKQAHFARGVSAHVGPVTGWHPPLTRSPVPATGAAQQGAAG